MAMRLIRFPQKLHPVADIFYFSDNLGKVCGKDIG